MARIDYSWVMPVWNEVGSLPGVLDEIRKVMKGKRYEVIAVDDGSTDGSGKWATIKSDVHEGKWQALRKGFAQARGKIIITCDSDGQDVPGEVNKLLGTLGRGYDVVSGWRKNRQDAEYRIVISKLGSKLMGFYDLNSPFKVYRKEVLEKLPQEGSLLRFSAWFARKMGYRVCEIPVGHRKREYGKSKFGIVKYLRIIYDAMLVSMLFRGSGRVTENFRETKS